MCQPVPDIKKQLNRTSQYLTEKIGGVKDDTEMDEEYFELARKVDAIEDSVEKIRRRLKEYMQPNSSIRATLAVQTCLYSVKGQQGSVETKFLEPEFKLANVLLKAGNGLSSVDASKLENNNDGVHSKYSSALLSMGEAFTKLSDLKELMVEEARVNLLTPLYDMKEKYLKSISFQRKKLETRRLDYKYKKGQGDKIPDEEFKTAEDKFKMSKAECLTSMVGFIETDETLHVDMLRAFADAVRRYHRECADLMIIIRDQLQSEIGSLSKPAEENVCSGEAEIAAKERRISDISRQSRMSERSRKSERSLSHKSQLSNKEFFYPVPLNDTTIKYNSDETEVIEEETEEKEEQGNKIERNSSLTKDHSHKIERSYSQSSQGSTKKRFSLQSFNNTTLKYTNDAYAGDDLNTSLPSMVV